MVANPYISILLPTRKRTDLLQSSLTSLLDKTNDPKRLEILIAYDEDDQESHEFFQSDQWSQFLSRWQVPGRTFCCPAWGYGELHRYINFLAKENRAPWMLFWNDDAVMETQDWDSYVKAEPDFIGLLHMTCSNKVMACSLFPLFSASWVELFGMVSLSNHIDSWISDIASRARCRRVIPVSVFHDRYTETGRNNDETYQNRQYKTNDYHLPDMVEARSQWVQRLIDYKSTPKVS